MIKRSSVARRALNRPLLLACFWRGSSKIRIYAFTLFAEFVCFFGSATITKVPSTFAVVIVVVADAVAPPRGMAARI